MSFFGPFDHRDFENHSRLTNLTDIQNIATELVHPLDHTESGYRDPTVRSSPPFSSDGIVRKRLRAAWLLVGAQDRLEQAARDVCCQGISLSVGARGGCVSVSAAIEMADMAEELVTIPPSLPSLRSLPVFASLALGGSPA